MFSLGAPPASRYLLGAQGTCVAALRGHCGDELPETGRDFARLNVPPRIRLLIGGGGHVGHAVARIAHEVDFEVWVLDDRDSCIPWNDFPTRLAEFSAS